jgi:hypothetical protein
MMISHDLADVIVGAARCGRPFLNSAEGGHRGPPLQSLLQFKLLSSDIRAEVDEFTRAGVETFIA